MVEFDIEQTPYAQMTKLLRLKLLALEAPGGAITFVRRLKNRVRIPDDQAQIILNEATEVLKNTGVDRLGSSPKIDSFLCQGYEASVFRFYTTDGRWVMKIGNPYPCVPGILSPISKEYASMMRWNYALLSKRLIPSLPNILPQPYFVIAPDSISSASTVQLLPYADKLADYRKLDKYQVSDLIRERQKFYDLSRQLRLSDRVIPDMIRSENLIVAQKDNGCLHYLLLDIGLYNLRAPTPILNFLDYLFQRISLNADINSLRNSQERKTDNCG